MSKKYRLIFLILLLVGFGALVVHYLRGSNIAVLNPKGPIAAKERNLIYFTLLLSLIVVVPVYVMTIAIAWRYRAGNTKARYSPNLDHNLAAETTWWLVPTVLIVILSVVTWRSSHSLDPSRALAGNTKPLSIQVVAMDWKWLFIYPQLKIASVNLLQIPVNTPLDFQITSDAPMNSFWIPQLGGQIYAMAGMTTNLHLEADQIGSYHGSSANISGRGFAGMTFIAKASSRTDFQHWANDLSSSVNPLNLATYNALAKPSQNNAIAYYSLKDPGLYDNIVMKYMMPGMGSSMR